MLARCFGLRQFHRKGQTTDYLVSLGGEISPDGRNVCFQAGEVYDKVSKILELPDLPLPEIPAPETVESYLKEQGPKIWKAAHDWAQTNTDLSEDHVTVWLTTNVYDRLPTCQCGCRPHWKEMMGRTPPPFNTTNRQMADWLYERHDEVSVKLGRQPIGLEAARLIHESGNPSASSPPL